MTRVPRPKQLSFDDTRLNKGHGGLRSNAGRPPIYKRPPVHHVRRPPVAGRYPCHVRLKVVRGIPNLRQKRFIREFRKTLTQACVRRHFRVVHYSVQRNHVHLVVEAAGKQALANGMKSIGARLARAVNRVFKRSGRVLFGRYWLRILRSPREVRNVLAYVLLNARKHHYQATRRKPPVQLDVCSSGAWFDGWKTPPPRGDPDLDVPLAVVATARTELLRKRWKIYGLIDPVELPGA